MSNLWNVVRSMFRVRAAAFVPQRFSLRSTVVVIAGLAVLLTVLVFGGSRNQVTIGVEGRQVFTFVGPRLTAVPFTDGDPLAVRIVAIEALGNGFRYDVRYMPYGPGNFDVSDYLVDANSKRPAGLLPLPIRVHAMLPKDYSGKLFDTSPTDINLHSNYRLGMALLWFSWGLLLAPLILYGHKTRKRMAPVPPPPTIAARLHELLQLGTHSELQIEQQADIEKLLLAHWAERLCLSTDRLEDTLAQLRQHPSAGRQVHRLEMWLHKREKTFNGGIARELLDELGWS